MDDFYGISIKIFLGFFLEFLMLCILMENEEWILFFNKSIKLDVLLSIIGIVFLGRVDEIFF